MGQCFGASPALPVPSLPSAGNAAPLQSKPTQQMHLIAIALEEPLQPTLPAPITVSAVGPGDTVTTSTEHSAEASQEITGAWGPGACPGHHRRSAMAGPEEGGIKGSRALIWKQPGLSIGPG